MAEPLLLHGQKMIPQKLIDCRIQIHFPTLKTHWENCLLSEEVYEIGFSHCHQGYLKHQIV